MKNLELMRLGAVNDLNHRSTHTRRVILVEAVPDPDAQGIAFSEQATGTKTDGRKTSQNRNRPETNDLGPRAH